MACRYAGIDWASARHDVLVAEEHRETVLEAAFAHDEKGLTSLCRTLERVDVGLVAIERPDGLLLERLLDAGLRVLALHSNKVAAAGDRFRASGGKSDKFDAFVLCEFARADSHRFRVLEPDSDATKAIRALTRVREDLVGTRTGVMNQVRSELERFWPGPLRLFGHMDAEILLAFLERYPRPQECPWSRSRKDARVLGARALLRRAAPHGGRRKRRHRRGDRKRRPELIGLSWRSRGPRRPEVPALAASAGDTWTLAYQAWVTTCAAAVGFFLRACARLCYDSPERARSALIPNGGEIDGNDVRYDR